MASPLLTTFSLFPDLPKELRLQIWARAVEPRVLRLRCSIQPLHFYNITPSLYLIGGYGPPHQHFTLNQPPRPQEPYFTVHLEPHEYSPPPLVSVCKESRDIAFETGCKIWPMSSSSNRVIWNPRLDSILLEEEHRVENPLDVFLQQFPEQAREVRRLAAWSSVWKRSAHADVEKLFPLMEMALDEFVVVADEEFERLQVEALRTESRRGAQVAWKIPESLGICYLKAQARYLGSHPGANVRKPPVMRVVQSPEGLLEGEALNLALRVWPSESMGFGSVEGSSALDDIIVRINGWKLHIHG